MYKLVLAVLLVIYSCTDQHDEIKYIFRNATNRNLEVKLYSNSNGLETKIIEIDKSETLCNSKAPDYIPFFGIDSIVLIFSDGKRLKFSPPKSQNDCIGINRNPFCFDTDYKCLDNNCTFTITMTDYNNAK